MEQLSPLDTAFLEIEDEDHSASLAIASLAVIDGPAPGPAEFAAAITAQLPRVPRYHQKVRRVPFDLGPPIWVDDKAFDPANHFKRIALPAPHDESVLCELVGLLMSERLGRDRPLWQFWVIEGLPDGRWAILSKVHHCLADGISANAVQTLLFTAGTAPAETTSPSAADPGAMSLLARSLGSLLTNPIEQSTAVAKSLLSPKKTARRISDAARGLAAMTAALIPPTASFLTGPIGQSRGYAVARLSLPDIHAIGKAFDVTINDVLLAAVSGAFRELLLKRGEEPAADTLRTLVPVSVRTTDTAGTVNNQVSLLLPLLPVDLADPVQRLIHVHRRVGKLKASKEAEAGAFVTGAAGHGPFGPIAWAIRGAAKLPQRNIVTVVTNVPGPREHLSVLGREVVELYPYVPIALQLRTGVAIASYRDEMFVGVTSDLGTVPEGTLLAEAIARDVSALCDAARESTA